MNTKKISLHHRITYLLSSLFIATGLILFSSPSPTSAASSHVLNAGGGVGTQIEKKTGLGNTSVATATGTIINILLGLLGVIVTVLLFYGGFVWMSANGNDEKISEAKKLIIGAIIGLFIIFLSASLTRLIIRSLASASGAKITGVEAKETTTESESTGSGFEATIEWGDKKKSTAD